MSAMNSEDELGRKWDRFGANCLVKIGKQYFCGMQFNLIATIVGAGIAVGAVFSVVLLRRRMWPIYAGSGTGFGFALNDLQHDLRSRT